MSTVGDAVHPAALSDRTKKLALVSAILASTIAAVDSSAVNVALPAIGRDLGGGFAAQQWGSNAYLLTLSALILLGGSGGRRADRRPAATGRLRGAAHAGRAGHHRRRLPQERAGSGDRQVDG